MQIAARTCLPHGCSEQTWPHQDPWEFWEHVRDHVVHIHIKDATWNPAKNFVEYGRRLERMLSEIKAELKKP
jgi:sugar phosphate isomerase/epimerase